MKPKRSFHHFNELDNNTKEINYNEYNELLDEGYGDDDISRELNLSRDSIIKLSTDNDYKEI